MTEQKTFEYEGKLKDFDKGISDLEKLKGELKLELLEGGVL